MKQDRDEGSHPAAVGGELRVLTRKHGVFYGDPDEHGRQEQNECPHGGQITSEPEAAAEADAQGSSLRRMPQAAVDSPSHEGLPSHKADFTEEVVSQGSIAVHRSQIPTTIKTGPGIRHSDASE